MMTYGNVYVASISLGANYQQAIDALVEAERYHGPAIVIAYCPCINHGIRPGLGHSIIEERRAVESGYSVPI
jgi:pyruvate-ferredoxin/flavodoxin oxidoreductase